MDRGSVDWNFISFQSLQLRARMALGKWSSCNYVQNTKMHILRDAILSYSSFRKLFMQLETECIIEQKKTLIASRKYMSSTFLNKITCLHLIKTDSRYNYTHMHLLILKTVISINFWVIFWGKQPANCDCTFNQEIQGLCEKWANTQISRYTSNHN